MDLGVSHPNLGLVTLQCLYRKLVGGKEKHSREDVSELLFFVFI